MSGEAKAVGLQRQLDNSRTENLRLDSERDELKLKVKEKSLQISERSSVQLCSLLNEPSERLL